MRRYIIFLAFVWSIDVFAIDLIAHRANAGKATENSIEAVRSAWAMGSDAIELDVRVSSDGVPYLFHDDVVGSHTLSTLTFYEMRQLIDETSSPTLAAVLNLGEPAGYYLLDLKIMPGTDAQPLIDAIVESEITREKIVFQSDNISLLSRIQRMLPNARYFFLTRLKRKWPFFTPPDPDSFRDVLSGYEIDGISMKGRSFIDSDFIETLQKGGFLVNVWIINDANRARYYAAIGVDGLITDNPVELRKVLDEDRRSGRLK